MSWLHCDDSIQKQPLSGSAEWYVVFVAKLGLDARPSKSECRTVAAEHASTPESSSGMSPSIKKSGAKRPVLPEYKPIHILYISHPSK